ncbi:nucleoside monophosphate kinase [Candidatus Berkelbacteria bacterium]|nr:nucleoside monophosphate kinase [Candidatus Berkelbacteria bacterium]
MASLDFPVFQTHVAGSPRFDLSDPVERRKYFDLKAGPEIEKLRDWLRDNTFVAFLLGPKNSGKGTYTKLFIEALGTDRVAHISVGDIVRSVHFGDLQDASKHDELRAFLAKRYRGFITLDKIVEIIEGRDTKSLLPTEVILALVEREIDRIGKQSIFIDGFPRNLDQISYSLYFRSIIGYRHDPDFLVFIDVPESVIDERMRGRVICPICHTPRGLKLLRTNKVGYDKETNQFYLVCDTPSCDGARLIAKEGDDLGIEAIRDRIEIDKKVMQTLLELEGLPKVYLRNSVPVVDAATAVNDYEITPAYRYEHDAAGTVKILEEPWIVKDDHDRDSYSLLPAAVTVSLIKQTAKVLGL